MRLPTMLSITLDSIIGGLLLVALVVGIIMNEVLMWRDK